MKGCTPLVTVCRYLTALRDNDKPVEGKHKTNGKLNTSKAAVALALYLHTQQCFLSRPLLARLTCFLLERWDADKFEKID